MAQSIVTILILLAVAFVPSLIYLVWMRNTERYQREPYGRLLRVFLIGATLSVAIAVVLEVLLMVLLKMNIERVYEILGRNPGLDSLILACVVAPFVEEASKGLGVSRVRRAIAEVEDGIVYGAAVGLGFAATENLLYESSAYYSDGAQAFLVTAAIRSVSSALLHAGASSVVGLGIARKTVQGRSWVPYYLLAVLMHGAFNYAASFGTLYEKDFGQMAYLVGLAAAVLIAIIGISAARSKIRELERKPRQLRW